MANLYTYSCMDIILSTKRKLPNRLFSLFVQEHLYQRPTLFYNSSPEFLVFDTLYDTVSKILITQNIYLFITVLEKLQEIPLFQVVAAS